MRLSQKDIDTIKKTIKSFIPDAEIYIFGSILDKNKKGGDIDLFIITNQKIDFLTKSQIKFQLENSLFRPIDLIFHKNFNLAIEKEALKGLKL